MKPTRDSIADRYGTQTPDRAIGREEHRVFDGLWLGIADLHAVGLEANLMIQFSGRCFGCDIEFGAQNILAHAILV